MKTNPTEIFSLITVTILCLSQFYGGSCEKSLAKKHCRAILRFSESGEQSCSAWLVLLCPGYCPTSPFPSPHSQLPLRPPLAISSPLDDSSRYTLLCFDHHTQLSALLLSQKTCVSHAKSQHRTDTAGRGQLGIKGRWGLSLPPMPFVSLGNVFTNVTVLLHLHRN